MLKAILFFSMMLAINILHAGDSPAASKRIVVLEFSLLDDLDQLGLKPIGVGTSGFVYEGSDPEYLKAIFESTASVGAREAPNLEAIANLKPDLIIGDVDFNQGMKSQLEKIAPTILLKGIFGLPEDQIRNLKTMADLTQMNEKVLSVIDDYQKEYEKTKEIANKGGASTILIGFPTANNSFNALANNSITSQILARLGKHNLIIENTSSQLFELSMEGLVSKNPDQIVILVNNDDLSAYHLLKKNLLWQQLAAVKTHKVYFADRNIWGKSHGLQALKLMYQEGARSGFLANQPLQEELA